MRELLKSNQIKVGEAMNHFEMNQLGNQLISSIQAAFIIPNYIYEVIHIKYYADQIKLNQIRLITLTDQPSKTNRICSKFLTSKSYLSSTYQFQQNLSCWVD